MRNFIKVARETIHICECGYYEINGEKIELSVESKGNYNKVKVYSPEMLGKMNIENGETQKCKYTFSDLDSLEAAAGYENALVMNFANAHIPGGGFLAGATAQEESLCRCSTLYISISSEHAKEMYAYNRKHLSLTESHYMLLSPHVKVFRNHKCELLKIPYEVGVITVPAPNRHGKAMFTSKAVLEKVMTERIRYMLNVAHENKYKYLVLGAWGCGAFGNKAADVAEYFYKVLVEEQQEQWFHEVCFAVLGGGKKLDIFKRRFASES